MSGEVIARVHVAYPKIKALLDAALPPKMLALASGQPAEAIVQPTVDLQMRVEDVKRRINTATFTGKGDKDAVPVLYTDFIERFVGALAQTLAATAGDAVQELPEMPAVSVPAAVPLRFAEGQVLLLLGDADGRRAGGLGRTQLGAVDGASVVRIFGGSSEALSFDGCDQRVLPWRRPAEGWEAAFRRDAEALPTSKVIELTRQLSHAVERLEMSTLDAAGVGVVQAEAEALVKEAAEPFLASIKAQAQSSASAR